MSHRIVKELFHPSLEHVASVLQDGLQKQFTTVHVSIKDCPDLTQKPWNLAAKGICGSPTIAEFGSPDYLAPVVHRNKNYSFSEVSDAVEIKNPFIIGACAGSWKHMGVNSELIPNTHLGISRNSHSCKVDKDDDSKYILEKYDSEDFSLLGNFLACEGKQGQVIHVIAKCRTGPKNFISTLREALKEHFKTNIVGMGGVFVIRNGIIKAHVMPDFSKVPLCGSEAVSEWLNFYKMPTPVTCLSVFVSDDTGDQLRLEHTHFFSDMDHGCGGHYHADLDESKETVEYEGFFQVGERLVRIDQP